MSVWRTLNGLLILQGREQDEVIIEEVRGTVEEPEIYKAYYAADDAPIQEIERLFLQDYYHNELAQEIIEKAADAADREAADKWRKDFE